MRCPKNDFNLAHLRERLKPVRLYYFPRLRSTNDHAAALRRRGKLFAPAAVLTSRQISGRGRGQNTWWSSAGSLTVTFVLPVDEHIGPHQLPLIAGLAVRNAAAELTQDQRVQLKWPNDILFNWKKVGGLLCERVLNADLVGIGLNVNVDPARAPATLRDQITSLARIRGRMLDMTEALIIVAAHLRVALRRAVEHPFAGLLREYDAHHALLGRKVGVTTAPGEAVLRGRCQGLDSTGRLVLRERAKLHHLIAGQVEVG